MADPTLLYEFTISDMLYKTEKEIQELAQHSAEMQQAFEIDMQGPAWPPFRVLLKDRIFGFNHEGGIKYFFQVISDVVELPFVEGELESLLLQETQQQEVERLTKALDAMQAYATSWEFDYLSAQAELDECLDALQYYADADYSYTVGTGIALDRGKKARLALEEVDRITREALATRQINK